MKNIYFLLLFSCLTLVLQGQQQLYVSLDGDNNNTGTIASPLATLEAARDKIREIKTTTGLPEGGVEVILRGGMYNRASSFELTSQDAGTENAPIIYKSYSGEEVILLSGKSIDAADWQPLSAQATARVHPYIGAGQLYELNYDTLGIQNGDFLNGSAQSIAGPTSFNLFVNGERQTIAQWPNIGENVTGYNDPGWATPNGTRDNYSFYFGAGGQPTDEDATNELDLDGTNRSARWKARLDSGNDLWLRGHWRTPWAPRLSLVDDINTNEAWIKLTNIPSGGMGSKYTSTFTSYDGNDYRKGSGRERYYAINMLEEIDQPGEYAIDFQDRKVYYFPPNDIDSLDIYIVDDRSTVIKIDTADYIQIENITIKGGLENGISATASNYLIVSGCTIDGVGNTGIVVRGGSDHIIQCNDVFNTGRLGMYFAQLGDRASLTGSNTLVTNNHIHHIGKLDIGSPGIATHTIVGVRFSHNLIHHTPSAGISHQLDNNCIFEYNEIHNCALQTADTGATYGTQHWETYGNIFRYNFIHHNRRANGFYADDGNSGDFHYKNIIHNCIDALKFGGGHDNIADNNLLISNGFQRIDDRGIGRNYRLGTRYETDLLAFNPYEEPWLSYGVQLKNDHNLTTNLWSDVLTEDWHPEYPNGCRYKDNATVESDTWRLPATGNITFEGNEEVGSIDAAGFYDFANMDLRTDNTTILSKFPELNTEFPKMGLIVSGCRTEVPSRESVGGLENEGAANTEGEDDLVDRTVVVDLNKTQYQYDFGPANSPTPDEWRLVRPDVIGSIYWTGDATEGEDQATDQNTDSLKQDFIKGNGTSQLNIKIANGIWKIEMVMGEQNTSHSDMRVKAEGNYIGYDVQTLAGQFKYLDGAAGSTSPASVDVTVNDGELNLEIYTNTAQHWAINHLKLTRVATEITVNPNKRTYQYDFGAVDSKTEDRWTVLSPLDYGDVYWTGAAMTTQDQGLATGISNLTRDLISSNGTVNFNHKISNGIWRVELVMGEQNLNHWGMIVGREGATMTYNIATAAGEFKYIGNGTASVAPTYFDVPVTDGELNVHLRVQASRPWVANHIKLTKIADDVTVDTDKIEYKYDFGAFDSEAQSGWQIITPDDYGDINWTGAPLTTQDQGTDAGTTDLTRDFVSAAGMVNFNHALSNGKWQVEMVMGNQNNSISDINISAEGTQIVSGISLNAGEYMYIDTAGGSLSPSSFEVLVSDGEFNLSIDAANQWALNHLKLSKVGQEITVDLNALSYQYDFGPINSQTEDGWTIITGKDYGDVQWDEGVFSIDRGTGVNVYGLKRDFVYSLGTLNFNHLIANGLWRIELVMGDRATNHWNMRVKAEGESIHSNIWTATNEFLYISENNETSIDPIYFDVPVTDGELNIEFSVGSSSRPWVANHIKLTKLMDTDGDGIYDIDDICMDFDDNIDTDNDNIPDGCDACPEDANNDGNNDGICDNCINIQLQAYLEGAYDTNTNQMTTNLQSRGLLPGQTPVSPLATPTPAGQPYQIAPWNYSGTEGTSWTDTNYTGDETDWVLISFRTGTAKSTEVAQTAALLMKGGTIELVNRCPLSSTTEPLYIVLEHRNHIGIMTPQPIDIIDGILMYDFRTSDTYRDPTSFGQKQLSNGEWAMFAGDANQMDFPSFDVNGTDKTEWFNANGVFDYYLSPDFNLDGDVNGQDKSLWFENNGISSRVPK